MIYKKFQDLELSALGMGAMRLPTIDGDDSKIDAAATQKMVDYAMEQGVNYYDTAWGYHNGNSELAMGEALKRNSPAMTSTICPRSRRSSKSSWKNARWIISTSTCSTTCAR